MNNLKIVIIDDEPGARNTLRVMTKNISDNLVIVKEFDSVTEAITELPSLTFDVLLLDIELIDGTGFDILKAFPKLGAKVIFTTAYDNHAMKAFKENAIDYLMKPINLDELKNALEKCNPKALNDYDYHQLLKAIKSDLKDTKIAIKSTNETTFINSQNIDYVQADGSYCCLYLCDGRVITSTKPLKHYEDILPNNYFFKINRQELVNIQRISVFKKNIGHGIVIMHNGEELKISRRKKMDFNNLIRGM